MRFVERAVEQQLRHLIAAALDCDISRVKEDTLFSELGVTSEEDWLPISIAIRLATGRVVSTAYCAQWVTVGGMQDDFTDHFNVRGR